MLTQKAQAVIQVVSRQEVLCPFSYPDVQPRKSRPPLFPFFFFFCCNLCPLQWKGGVLTTGQPGNPPTHLLVDLDLPHFQEVPAPTPPFLSLSAN